MPKKPSNPEVAFRAALSSTYPGMSPEMRNGIVGLAVRAFITPVEIAPRPDRDRESNHLLRDII